MKGKAEQTSIKRHFGSATTSKTVTFRTTSEAEMNHAMELIKESIQDQGGMTEEHPVRCWDTTVDGSKIVFLSRFVG